MSLFAITSAFSEDNVTAISSNQLIPLNDKIIANLIRSPNTQTKSLNLASSSFLHSLSAYKYSYSLLLTSSSNHLASPHSQRAHKSQVILFLSLKHKHTQMYKQTHQFCFQMLVVHYVSFTLNSLFLFPKSCSPKPID